MNPTQKKENEQTISTQLPSFNNLINSVLEKNNTVTQSRKGSAGLSLTNDFISKINLNPPISARSDSLPMSPMDDANYQDPPSLDSYKSKNESPVSDDVQRTAIVLASLNQTNKSGFYNESQSRIQVLNSGPSFITPTRRITSPSMDNQQIVFKFGVTEGRAPNYFNNPIANNGLLPKSSSWSFHSPNTNSNDNGQETPKRKRKKRSEVVRPYRCDFPECGKTYGQLKHLNYHRSIKNHGHKIYAFDLKEDNEIYDRIMVKDHNSDSEMSEGMESAEVSTASVIESAENSEVVTRFEYNPTNYFANK